MTVVAAGVVFLVVEGMVLLALEVLEVDLQAVAASYSAVEDVVVVGPYYYYYYYYYSDVTYVVVVQRRRFVVVVFVYVEIVITHIAI